jgi:hypothetical protein
MAFLPVTPRYSIERHSYNSWLVFDTSRPNDSTVYILLLNRVRNSYLNYQVTLAKFNGSVFPDVPFFMLEKELYSTQYYAATPDIALRQVEEVFEVLQDNDIENPYLLNRCFGGMLLNERVPIPRMPFTN